MEDSPILSHKSEENQPFPPPVVYFDGTDYWLADGFHRVRAAIQIRHKRIGAEIRHGTQRDAVLHSVGANAEHGMRRSNEDKRRAVLTLLNDEEWGQWSDRKIAKACSVSHEYVSQIRESICQRLTDAPKRKVERNGKIYTMDTSGIGRSTPDTTPAGAPMTPPLPEVASSSIAVHHNSDSPESYTSDDLVQAVIDVMGRIDLDPYSNSRYTPNVPAQLLYTREDDGLSKRWSGRVYMKPPHGDEIGDWVEKLVTEYASGAVQEAIGLVPAYTDTKWFQSLLESPICFMRGRLKPKNANDSDENSAPFPSAVVYLGKRHDRFATRFEAFGPVLIRYQP